MTLDRPLALVTGSARRLGRAFALRLSALGYDLALHYHSSTAEAEVTASEAAAFGAQTLLLAADLSRPEEIDALFVRLDEWRVDRPLNLLVNSAAVMTVANPKELSLADWDSALDLNLRAPFLLSQAAARRMTAGGSIVNISDLAAQKTWSRYAPYSVSKAGLEALTRLLARTFAPDIRVNAIAPGLVLPSEVVTPEGWDELVRRLPLRRPAALEEITSALEFLIQNGYITGQTLVIDGGYSLI